MFSKAESREKRKGSSPSRARPTPRSTVRVSAAVETATNPGAPHQNAWNTPWFDWKNPDHLLLQEAYRFSIPGAQQAV